MRISFDLDEVLFVSPEHYDTEDKLPFPLDRIFPERLRRGTVDLIHTLQDEGFEVWVYTSSFRSRTYIRALFRNYGIVFDDIINGDRHKEEVQRDRTEPLPQKMPSFYHISLHVDDEDAVIENGKKYGFRVYRLYEEDPQWTEKLLTEARRIRKMEESQ